MIALFMSYVHLSIDFWSMDKFFPPSASLLSTEVLLLFMKGDHPKDHTEELAFPQAGCFPPLIWIFFVHLAPSPWVALLFSVNLKSNT